MEAPRVLGSGGGDWLALGVELLSLREERSPRLGSRLFGLRRLHC